MSEKLLPEFLWPVGYTTGWIGKWHLGAAPEFRPENRGFKETFGFIGGGHHFINWQVNGADSHWPAEYSLPIERNGKPVEETNHLTVAFGCEASSFINRHKGEPWFLYLAFNAPHMPNEPTPERLAQFSGITNKLRRTYAAQVSLMDDAIGETLQALRDTGQAGRTLIFFFSDNGGQIQNGASNAPLRGNKGDVYEGGMRVPFVVSWPGRLPSGKDYAQTVSSLDVFATALACAGVPMPTNCVHDGVNLIPFLAGEKPGSPHDRLFWRRNDTSLGGMRSQDMKLVCIGGQPAGMFNLATDLGETENLASSNAAACSKMKAELAEWFAQMSPTLAFPGGQGKQRDWSRVFIETNAPAERLTTEKATKKE